MTKKPDLSLVTICFLLISGCGLFSKSEVPRDQVDADIKRQTLEVKFGDETVEWEFDNKLIKPLTCFAINTDGSKISELNADLSVTVASWRHVTIQDKPFYSTVYGKMLMRYGKEGDRWILENAEPQDITLEKPENGEAFKKFVT